MAKSPYLIPANQKTFKDPKKKDLGDGTKMKPSGLDQPKPVQRIVFNDDNSVTVDGQTVSKKAYEESQGMKESSNTVVNDIRGREQMTRQQIADEILKNQVREQLTRQEKIKLFASEILGGTPPEAQLPTVQTLKDQAAYKAEQLKSPERYTSDSTPAKISQAFGMADNPYTFKGAADKMFVTPAADLIDMATSVFRNGKSLEQKKAEELFAEAEKAINADILQVKIGAKSPQEAMVNLEEAASALNMLESAVKNENKINIVYAKLKGLDVQSQIKTRQSLMEGYRLEIIKAAQENELNQRQAMLGQAGLLNTGSGEGQQ